jgi:hypothetical protein
MSWLPGWVDHGDQGAEAIAACDLSDDSQGARPFVVGDVRPDGPQWQVAGLLESLIDRGEVTTAGSACSALRHSRSPLSTLTSTEQTTFLDTREGRYLISHTAGCLTLVPADHRMMTARMTQLLMLGARGGPWSCGL